MDDKQMLTLQKSILNYFENTSDDDFVAFIESFVYNKGTKKSSVSKMISKFLEDNGLTKAFMNYVSDQRNPDQYFKRASGSDITMIESIKWALLNVAFNRYRSISDIYQVKKKIKEEHAEMKRLITTLMDAGSTDRYNETLDDMKFLVIDKKW